MALHAATLKTRTLTALLFVTVMGCGLFIHAWSYLLLVLSLLTISWVEYQKLVDGIKARSMHPYVTMGWILHGWAVSINFSIQEFKLGSYSLRDVMVIPLLMAGFILLIWGTLSCRSTSIRQWLLLAAGNLYLTLPWALAQHLYGYSPYPDAADLLFTPAVWWIVIAISTMWVNDTMAYILGSLIGRTPFSKISPKKTWEGTISGIICATALLGWIFDHCFLDEVFHPLVGYVLIFFMAVAGTLGDLFESKLKRLAGVKDSGHLMPGHGGVLDRFDSLLFAIPVLYLCLRLLSMAH